MSETNPGGGNPPPANPGGGNPPPANPGGGGNPAGGQPNGGGGSAPYRPEGLPETMFGTSDKETIDKVAGALNGYRTRDSTRGAVPEKPDGYKFEWSEPLKPYEAALNSDEFGKAFLSKVQTAAHKYGLGDKQLGGFLNDVMGLMVSEEMVEPPFDKAKERAALLPDAAKTLSQPEQDAAIEKRVNENLAWIQAMQAQGMPKESAELMTAMLGDRADGVKGLEWLAKRVGGGPNPGGGGAGAGGSDRLAAVKARETAPETDPSHPKYKEFIAETQRLWQELGREGLLPDAPQSQYGGTPRT